jgi:hypothetical protein
MPGLNRRLYCGKLTSITWYNRGISCCCIMAHLNSCVGFELIRSSYSRLSSS